VQSQFQHNHELKKFKTLNSRESRDELGMEGAVFGALYMYPRLKTLYVNTSRHGILDTSAKSVHANKRFSSQV